MTRLNPRTLFEQLANDVPRALHGDFLITGSLAAAYHFQTRLDGGGVNTKDADLLVHPAGNLESCRQMTETLLKGGWTRHPELCYPCDKPTPLRNLRLIRLFPPNSTDYFVELLSVPEQGQKQARRLIQIEILNGWYALASFRFMGLTSVEPNNSHVGLKHASPAMMSLANLLSHPKIGTDRMESGTFSGLLRSAKDLGRVLALAWLEGREPTAETWRAAWKKGLKKRFPKNWRSLACNVGRGLRSLLEDPNAMRDAQRMTASGLLSGHGVTVSMLAATGERLLQDVIEPLESESRRRTRSPLSNSQFKPKKR